MTADIKKLAQLVLLAASAEMATLQPAPNRPNRKANGRRVKSTRKLRTQS